ncbi:uncharacterized protein LOC135485290 isoform X2 [Lineus longissimus]|uniref:uncharacterized protein LOC135485290 isoform X2 n=1 Tax=Lineus longissimus TaxID=88925 RepID=UPI00315DB1B3
MHVVLLSTLFLSVLLDEVKAFCPNCDIQLTSFTPTVPVLPVGSAILYTFGLTIKNLETGGAVNKRIDKVNTPNENYKLTLFYSNFDVNAVGIGSNSITQTPGQTTTIPVFKTPGAALVGLNTQAELKVEGEGTLTIPAAECSLVRFVCLFVEPGSGADWSDSNAADNYRCQDVKSSITKCGVDIIGTNFAMNVGNPVVKSGKATSLGFDIVVKNNAPVGSGADINAAAGANFAVDLYFAQADISVTRATIKTVAFPASTTGDLTAALAPGSSTALYPMTATATIPAVDCPKYTWACACVKKGNAAAYDDLDVTNNCQCLAATSLISCPPDVNIVSVTPTGAAVIDDYTTPVGSAADFGVDVKINNVAAAGIENNIVAAVGSDRNYILSLKLTDANLRAGGTDTLALPAGNIALTHPATAQLQVGLTAGGLGAADQKDLSAIAKMTIPTASCKAVKYLCTTVSQDPTSTYPAETNLANNVKCVDLVASRRKNCKPKFNNLDKVIDWPELSAGVIYDTDASDPDSDTLTYSFAAGTLGMFTINSADGKVSLTTPFDFETGTNQYKLLTHADDGRGGTATGTLTVNVVDVNEPPVLTPSAAAVSVGEHTQGDIGMAISKVDPDVSNGQGITYSVQKPAGAPFTVDASGNVKVIAPGLDYRNPGSHTWVLEIIGVDKGSPAPVVRTGTTQVTVTITDEPDQPKISGMPATVSIKENVTDGPTEIFKVVATDPDGDSLTYVLQASPLDGKFRMDPSDHTKIQFTANPAFNYEKQKQYKLTVFVMDGTTKAAMGELTVIIIDIPEKPRFLNLPNKAYIPEHQFHGCQIFEVLAVDDENDPINIKMDVFHHNSGNTKFEIDKWGSVRTTYNNCLNHEIDPYYIANITACDMTGCAVANLTIYVEDWIEPPIFNPQFYALVLKESQSTIVPLPIDVTRLVTDPDHKDTRSCSIASSTFSSFIRSTGGCTIYLNKALDYDRYDPPHHFTADICAADSKGLTTCLLLHIYVTNVDDEAPFFTPNTYLATIPENSTGQTLILTMTCFDMDLGIYGEVRTWVDPSNAIAHRDYEAKLLGRTHQQRLAHKNFIEIRVRNQLDIEKYSVITFKVFAASPSQTGFATVTIYISNINDNKPKWNKTFYNWETSIYRHLGHVVGSVHGYDQDIIYNRVFYYLVKDSIEFSLDSVTGEVIHKIQHVLQSYHRYVIRAYIKDSDPAHDQGGVATIRIDTYVDKDVLTNWTSCNSVKYYKNETNKQQFLVGLRKMCSPCVPRIHDILNDNGKPIILLYFLTDDTTEYHRHVELVKQYVSPEVLMANFTRDLVETPREFVNNASSEIAKDCIEKITWYKYPDPKHNWILDTVEGNVILGIILSIGLTGLLTALICALQKAFHHRANYGLDGTPVKGEKTVSKSDVYVMSDDPNVMDFRYNNKPLVPASTHTDVMPDLPGTPTPPDSELPTPIGSRLASGNANGEIPSRSPLAGRVTPSAR